MRALDQEWSTHTHTLQRATCERRSSQVATGLGANRPSRRKTHRRVRRKPQPRSSNRISRRPEIQMRSMHSAALQPHENTNRILPIHEECASLNFFAWLDFPSRRCLLKLIRRIRKCCEFSEFEARIRMRWYDGAKRRDDTNNKSLGRESESDRRPATSKLIESGPLLLLTLEWRMVENGGERPWAGLSKKHMRGLPG